MPMQLVYRKPTSQLTVPESAWSSFYIITTALDWTPHASIFLNFYCCVRHFVLHLVGKVLYKWSDWTAVACTFTCCSGWKVEKYEMIVTHIPYSCPANKLSPNILHDKGDKHTSGAENEAEKKGVWNWEQSVKYLATLHCAVATDRLM